MDYMSKAGNIVSGNGMSPVCAKTLADQMMSYHQLDPDHDS